MALTNVAYFISFCLLAATVSATNNDEKSTSSSDNKQIPQPTKISALYIGDLLRTESKEQLETSESVHHPSAVKEEYVATGRLATAPVAGRIFTKNYKTHGGHEYLEAEYIQPSIDSTEGPTKPVKRVGQVPVSVLGQLHNYRLVSVPDRNVRTTSRNSGLHQGSPQPIHSRSYKKHDCDKHDDHSESSEERSYAPVQTTQGRSAGEPASVPEYRQTYRGYREPASEEEYSPRDHSSRYESESYPSNHDSNTKSQSSGGYTSSKSSSTSKTVIPKKNKPKVHVIPVTVSTMTSLEKELEQVGKPYGGGGVVVYKVKEPATHITHSHPENTDEEYQHSHRGSEHSSEGHNHSEEYSPYTRKPRKNTRQGRGRQEAPHHHSYAYERKPVAYDNQERGGYERRPVTPESYRESTSQPTREPYRQPANKPVYREPINPESHETYHRPAPEYTAKLHRNQRPPKAYRKEQQPEEYHPRSEAGEQPQNYPKTHYTDYRNVDEGSHYVEQTETQNPRKLQGRRSYHSSTPDGSVHNSYPEGRQSVPVKPKEKPQSGYERYPVEEPRTQIESHPNVHSYNQYVPRPVEERQVQQYAYEPKPAQSDYKQQSEIRYAVPHKHTQRSTRSSSKRVKQTPTESRVHSSDEEPHGILVTKESKPYVSQSVSYSESSYNMENEGQSRPKVAHQEQGRVYNAPQKATPPLANEKETGDSVGAEQQTVYKPYNSEYPASYAIDQPHEAPRQYEPIHDPHRDQSYEQQDAYPQSYEEQGPYDQRGTYDGSYGSEEAPAYHSEGEGYREEGGYSEPLDLDDHFFEKYGISKNAKIIVATALKPNFFVADGTHMGSESHAGGEEPVEEERYKAELNEEERYKSALNKEERYKPQLNDEQEEIPYKEAPQSLGAPKEIPGSFEDLVHTNPKFLRNLPEIMEPATGYFKTDSDDASPDDVEFRDQTGENKGFIISKGPREIVQQHGDGVSRIIFNIPEDSSKISESTKVVRYKPENGRRIDKKVKQVDPETEEKNE